MKAYDKEYYEIFDKFTNIKDALEEQVDLNSEEFMDFYSGFIQTFQTLYDWTERGFTILNDDEEDIESLIDDLRETKCKTFADLSLMYMSQYVDKLRTFIESRK